MTTLRTKARIDRVSFKEVKKTKRLRENIGQGNGFVFSSNLDQWMMGDHKPTAKAKPLF